MAVEIRELIIKAVITKEGKHASNSGDQQINQDKVVQECVDQVLKIIRRTNKR